MIKNPLGNNNNQQAAVDYDDLEMARPSYDATSYRRSGSVFRTSLVMIAILMFSSLAAGLYFYAYQRGLEDGQREAPPIVAANPAPIRVSPEAAGVASEKPENLNIHRIMNGNEEVMTPPATNDGQAESLLIGQSDPSEAETRQLGEQQTRNQNSERENGQADAQPTNPVNQAAPIKSKPAIPEAPSKTATQARPSSPAEADNQPAAKTTASAAPADMAAPRFMVQIAATRSRALARQTYTAEAKKYPDLLARRDPLILRVDLGSKGIFYRVNVSGFSTIEKAKQFCADLKTAGGSCLVKKEPA